MREIKFRVWDKAEQKMMYDGFCIIPTRPSWSATGTFTPEIFEKQEWFDCSAFDWADGNILSGNYILMQYIGRKDKNGKEACHFDIANGKYLLYLDLVYGIYLIDISNGAIIRYKEGIIDEITGNYFEQHEKISADCQRSIDKLISQTSRTM